MDIDFKQLTGDMLTAVKGVVGDNLNDIKDLAEGELEDFAKRTTELAKKVADGSISAAQAQAILKIRANAVETVLLSIAGIGTLAAQEAINAAIGVLKGVIKNAIPGGNFL